MYKKTPLFIIKYCKKYKNKNKKNSNPYPINNIIKKLNRE